MSHVALMGRNGKQKEIIVAIIVIFLKPSTENLCLKK